MSHLLYLHSFAVDRFVNVFGGGRKANVELLLREAHPHAIKLAPEAAIALVTRAVMRGLDGRPASKASKEEQLLLDVIVDHAVTTESFGIAPAPISPMGAGGPLFDALEPRFAEAGSTAKKLFEVLQRGRNYEGGIILLSPDDVRTAAKLLKKIADAQDPDDADETEEAFVQELVQPFAATAKKGRAVFGSWG